MLIYIQDVNLNIGENHFKVICGQVFLHYNLGKNGPYAKTNLYDKRPMLEYMVKNG